MLENRWFTLRQAGAELGVDEKTIARWAKQAQMSLTPAEFDKRRKLLNEAQLDQLRQLRDSLSSRATVTASPSGDEQKSATTSLDEVERQLSDMHESVEASLASLRDQVADLKTTLLSVTSSIASTTETVTLLVRHVVNMRVNGIEGGTASMAEQEPVANAAGGSRQSPQPTAAAPNGGTKGRS